MAMCAFALHGNREKLTERGLWAQDTALKEVFKPVKCAGHLLRNSQKLMVILWDGPNINNWRSAGYLRIRTIQLSLLVKKKNLFKKNKTLQWMWVNNFSKMFQNRTEKMTSQNEVQQTTQIMFWKFLQRYLLAYLIVHFFCRFSYAYNMKSILLP